MPDDAAANPLIVFTPSGKRGHFAKGSKVLDAARTLGVDIDSVCGGRGICGRCQVTQSVGQFAKHGIDSTPEALNPFSEVEEHYRKTEGMAEGRRLSCSCVIQGDLVIDVPRESQVHKQVVRKRAEVRDIKLDPPIRLHYVEVEEPDMHNPKGDLERLLEALRGQWGLDDLDECDLNTLTQLQAALRAGEWKVTVAVHRGQRICKIWPEFHDRAFGIAFDIGSTTIAAHLCNLQTGEILGSGGVMNPQIRFGEDLMSRVSYVMMNPGGEKELTAAVREAVNDLIEDMVEDAGIDRMDILNAVVVCNPIMHHLMLGIDPTELGGAPFALATNAGMNFWAAELDMAINPDGRVYIMPCIAGHVGADTAGVILSETPYIHDDIALIVDVGTNAEIVLGNRHQLLAASSPTGPAFEGAQISSGQRAAPGAIERVRINRETLEPRFKVIGGTCWSDEPGFEKEALKLGVTGICGSGIIEAVAEMFLSGIITQDGVINGASAAKTDRIRPDGRTFSYIIRDSGHDGEPLIQVTQNDVRAIQLAKAALYAGCRLLMDKMEIESVDRIVLAGAFGSHIDPVYALAIGLLPDCTMDRVVSAGNAAGTGARVALLDQTKRDEIERVVRDITKIETAVEPEFQRHFVEAMAFPHKTRPYPHLARHLKLPDPNDSAPDAAERGGEGAGGARRRRRRRAS
ncbi:MAG: ASKHA domain-containing protein [Rhodospirillales bacterium]